jgi:demethylmenaquinone methyltransferase / 2-methoxy-6-polyprenyl-1,4-benzoquinol methylase
MTSSPSSKEPIVRALFGRIASRYDLLNRLMTFGQDTSWRKQAIQLLKVTKKARVLDVGTGTGDIPLLITKSNPDVMIVGVDLTPGMLAVARQRSAGKRIHWVLADAQHLPFTRGTFDRAISAFLLRNVTDQMQSLREQARVLTAAGRVVAMETTPPRKGLLRPVAVFHLRRVIPFLGRVIARDAPAYRYLPRSIEDFVSGERLAEMVKKAGFSGVSVYFRMIGTVTIVAAQRRFDSDAPLEKVPAKTRKIRKKE